MFGRGKGRFETVRLRLVIHLVMQKFIEYTLIGTQEKLSLLEAEVISTNLR